MATGLPAGWAITPLLETVPDPNFPGPAAGAGFVRRTFICRDQLAQYVCSSGSLEDCQSQALTMAQSHTQQNT